MMAQGSMKLSAGAKVLASLAVATTALAGCAGSQDPAQAGFFDGIRNQTDGTYVRRQQALDDQASGLERANELLADDVSDLAATSAENERRIQQARGRLTRLRNETASLRARYEQEQARFSTELTTLDRVEGDIAREQTILASATGDTDVSASLQRIAQYRQIVDALPR